MRYGGIDWLIGRRCLFCVRIDRRHIQRAEISVATIDRIESLKGADLVDAQPAPLTTCGVCRIPGRDVRAQQPLDLVLDVCLGIVEQLDPALLLDPDQPGAQRLAQECEILLLERVVAAARNAQLACRQVKPASDLLELKLAGLKELSVIRRDTGRCPFHSLLKDRRAIGVIDPGVEALPIVS